MTGRVEIGPADPSDFERLIGKLPPTRVRALAARRDGEVIGVGGFLYFPDGTVQATMFVSPAGRQFPAAIFRAGVLAMRLARRVGLREVRATADRNEPAAERFLVRLGFAPIGVVDGETVFRWRR